MSSYARQEQDAAKTTQFHTTIEIEQAGYNKLHILTKPKSKGKSRKGLKRS
jgi:hypothetical protein